MPLPQATEDLYTTLQRYQLLLLAASRRLWRGMTPDFDSSWSRIAPSLVALTAGAQLAAARAGAEYVPTVLAQTNQPDRPLAAVRPQAFSGVASDGRSLAGLLTGSVVASKRAVAQGVDGGDALAYGQRWLEQALESAVADAARDASQAAVAVRPKLQWVRVVNAPCCSRCAVLAGRIYHWNASFDRHPQCFPAGVVVSGPGHKAATRRWFQGELVVLATASGQKLSLTGNHPVLTRRGWVPANLLHEGDEVVRGANPEGARALVVPDHHEMPARVEDVWGSLSVAGLYTMPTSPEDFHGDGQYGQVDVVRADGALDDWLQAALGQHLAKLLLALRSGSPLSLRGEGSPELLDLGQSAPTHCSVRGSGLGLALLGAHSGGSQSSGLARTATLHASGYEPFGDDAAGHAVLARDGVLAGSGLVRLDDLVDREIQPAKWDAPAGAFSVETREGYARTGLDLLDRLSGQVELDRLVEVRRVEWSGHVYSLTSVEGWHSANSLIVSNCDCLALPVTVANADSYLTNPTELARRGLIKDLTADQRARLDDGADLVGVLNESRDAWRARLAADRRRTKAEARRQSWGRGGNEPPPGTTVHDLMARLTSQVEFARAARAAGIAA